MVDMAVAFHSVQPARQSVACDDCGSLVDPSDQGRAAHQRWHDAQDAVVIDLTSVRDRADR